MAMVRTDIEIKTHDAKGDKLAHDQVNLIALFDRGIKTARIGGRADGGRTPFAIENVVVLFGPKYRDRTMAQLFELLAAGEATDLDALAREAGFDGVPGDSPA